MRIIGLAGWSGAGKTTLITRVVPLLNRRGIRVATIKHAHHAFEIDRPGKDSMAAPRSRRDRGRDRFQPPAGPSFTSCAGRASRRFTEILAKLSPADLVIIEGFKRHALPKLEIFRAALGKPLLQPDDDCIVAVAADAPLPQSQVPVLMLDDIEGIADVLQAEAVPRERIGAAPAPR